MTDRERLWTVSELAQEFEVTARAIRFYEDKGLLAPRRAGGSRVFDYRDRARLLLILRLKRLGFSLQDIKAYLDLYNVGDGRAQIELGYHKVCDRIDHLEQQIAETQAALAELRDFRDRLKRRLESPHSAREDDRIGPYPL